MHLVGHQIAIDEWDMKCRGRGNKADRIFVSWEWRRRNDLIIDGLSAEKRLDFCQIGYGDFRIDVLKRVVRADHNENKTRFKFKNRSNPIQHLSGGVPADAEIGNIFAIGDRGPIGDGRVRISQHDYRWIFWKLVGFPLQRIMKRYFGGEEPIKNCGEKAER